MEVIQHRFLWGDMEERRKYHLVVLEVIKKPLMQGVLDLRSMMEMNMALLGKMNVEIFERKGHAMELRKNLARWIGEGFQEKGYGRRYMWER